MFYLENMCCLCLKSTASLSDIFSTNRDEVTNFEKVESSLTRLVDAIEDDDDLLVCDQCSDIIDMIYRFNNICLRNIERFSSYKSILKQNKEKTRCNLIIKIRRDVEGSILKTNSENDESLNSDSEESSSSSGYIALADLDDSDGVPISEHDFDEMESNNPEQDKLLLSANREQPYESTSNSPDQFLVRSKQVLKDKKYICHICQKGCIQKADLERHIRIHTGEKPFTCVVCKKSFNQKCNLTKHMLIHSGEKPYVCNVCKKVFSQKLHLNFHKLIHSSIKPFKCDECSKSFTQKPHLVTHKRVHTGEKPFICDLCQKAFTDKSTLIQHRRIHTGEKPYSCDICRKTFAQRSGLYQHKRNHNH